MSKQTIMLLSYAAGHRSPRPARNSPFVGEPGSRVRMAKPAPTWGQWGPSKRSSLPEGYVWVFPFQTTMRELREMKNKARNMRKNKATRGKKTWTPWERE